MGKHRNHCQSAGFSLLELIVIVIVLGLLAGIVAPSAKNLIVDSKAQRIAELAEILRGACMRYEMDTDSYAREGVLDTPDARGNYSALITDRSQYNLSFPGGTLNWKGPYIDHSLLPDDNPVGQAIRVKDSLTDGPGMPGFDLDGTGVKKTGPGNMLVVQLDPDRQKALELATQVDEIIDKSKGAANWKSRGRVNLEAASNVLYIYLYQAP